MTSLNKKSKQSKENMQSTGTSGVIRQSQTNNSALNDASISSSNNNNEIIISQNNNSKEISCDEMLTLGKSKNFPKNFVVINEEEFSYTSTLYFFKFTSNYTTKPTKSISFECKF